MRNYLYKHVSEIKIHQFKKNLHSFYLFHVLFSQSITDIARNAFCIDCSDFFCETNTVCGKCKICNRRRSVRACIKCKTALRNSCNCQYSLTEANAAEFRNNPKKTN